MDFTDAVCVNSTADLWLSDEPREQDQAISLCHQCPVLAGCLLYARKLKPVTGVWAGRLYGTGEKLRQRPRATT